MKKLLKTLWLLFWFMLVLWWIVFALTTKTDCYRKNHSYRCTTKTCKTSTSCQYSTVKSKSPVLDVSKIIINSAKTSSVSQNTTKTSSWLLPLWDGKYSSTKIQKWYIYVCGPRNGWGWAQKDWPRISGWYRDPSKKLTIDGSVTRKNASFKISTNSTSRVIVWNGLPISHPTGIYPVQSTDDAYQYDKNPNSIKEQTISFILPLNPTFADKVWCVKPPFVAMSVSWVPIFDWLDAEWRDAVAHEVQDDCGWHPEKEWQYHYHNLSKCISVTGSDPVLVWYAIDWFGLYKYPKTMTNDDLDECHGMTWEVLRNGKKQTIYHYVVTDEYPYTIWCFRWTVADIK